MYPLYNPVATAIKALLVKKTPHSTIKDVFISLDTINVFKLPNIFYSVIQGITLKQIFFQFPRVNQCLVLSMQMISDVTILRGTFGRQKLTPNPLCPQANS